MLSLQADLDLLSRHEKNYRGTSQTANFLDRQLARDWT
jgi:hypothetical protein